MSDWLVDLSTPDAGQGHVFAHWDKCSASERDALVSQLSLIDLPRVKSVFARSVADHKAGTSSKGTIEPVKAHDSVVNADPVKLQRWRRRGLQAAAAGELAVVLLAGGQGTRLGSSDPKGMYDIGLPSGRTLFRLHAERLLKLGRMARQTLAEEEETTNDDGDGGAAVRIPWYIMTSPFTHAPTVKYFEDNDFFGLHSADVTFFQQGWLPCFDDDGAIIMQSKNEVATAPDGNGGLYAALHAGGCLDDMRHRGVKHVYAFCVDNALVQVGDPIYVGFCAERNAAAGAKVISKAYPEEPVGVFTRRDGKVHVVEYSELPPSLATATDPATGELRLNAANVVLHYYSMDFLTKCCEPDGEVQGSLVYHVASKKIPHVSVDGLSTVTPDTPNGIKLEAFIFDVYKYAHGGCDGGDGQVTFLEGERRVDFAPVKNKEGTGKDSPDTARKLISALHSGWIEAAGGKVVTGGEGEGGGELVEVAPAVSYGGEGLEAIVAGREVAAGTSIEVKVEIEEGEGVEELKNNDNNKVSPPHRRPITCSDGKKKRRVSESSKSPPPATPADDDANTNTTAKRRAL